MPSRSNGRTLKEQWLRLCAFVRNSRRKDLWIFLLFLCVSYFFWVIMSLNDDMQHDFNLRLEITEVPEGTTFITEAPATIAVGLRDKGTQLMTYRWKGTPTLKIRYADFTYHTAKDRLAMSKPELEARVRSLLGTATQVVAMRPDSLSLIVTDRPGKAVPVRAVANITSSGESVISGPITVEPESVMVYSARHLAVMPREVNTMAVSRSDVTDTLNVRVGLKPESGVRMIPDHVTMTVPVEPLIAKKRSVSINLHHVNVAGNVVMFPSNVTVSYLLPMSLYSSENGVLSVNADFRQRSSTKIPLTVGAIPDYYQGVSLSLDSVEYLIEQHIEKPQ